MQTDSLSDNDLLSAWVEHGCEESFHALVNRYAPLVRMTALRSCASETLAAEAAQLTFILLARKAKALTARRSLAGWLHLTAVMQVKNLVRQTLRETRKRRRFFIVMESESHQAEQEALAWREMRPVLDEALCALPDRDREALLLRFYRSLSVRETASALGIATEAAQKRLERALARLRSQLSRRGCQPSGAALAATLLTGFSAESRAAFTPDMFPVSNILSAGSGVAPPVTGAPILPTTAIFMKVLVIAPPALALLLSFLWISPKQVLVSKLEKKTALRPGGAPATPAGPSRHADESAAGGAPGNPESAAGAPLDWQKVTAHYEDGKDRKSIAERTAELKEYWRFQQRQASMSKEELADALATLPPQKSGFFTLKNELLGTLIAKDPEFALKRFSGQLSHYGGLLADALRDWARKDLDKAVAWFDERVAAGLFDSVALGGEMKIRERFDAALIGVLLPVDAGAAAARLESFTPAERDRLIRVMWMDQSLRPGTPETQAAYAGLIRGWLPPDQQAAAIAKAVGYMPITAEFTEVGKYLDHVAATPAERSLCAVKAAEYRIAGLVHERKISREDLEALRAWVGAQAPEVLAASTGKALGALAGKKNQMDFTEAAALARQYDAKAGNQEVLGAFLTSGIAEGNREQVLSLAMSIPDGDRRREILKKLP